MTDSPNLNRTVIVGFSDPIKNQWCELVVPDGGRVFPIAGEPKIGVDHPGCDERADLSVELDAFYCPKCRWNGRISGAWAVDVIESCSLPPEPTPRHAETFIGEHMPDQGDDADA
jgi:hypothetical protein